MKDKMQSLHLQEMMQQCRRHPEYVLALPFFMLKKKRMKNLAKGDLLLLGHDFLDLFLLKGKEVCARAVLESSGKTLKIKIKSLVKESENTYDSKKYEKILCSFGSLQSRKLETGHKVEISTIDMENVTLFAENQKVAEATLVTVDNEIALEITEVADE